MRRLLGCEENRLCRFKKARHFPKHRENQLAIHKLRPGRPLTATDIAFSLARLNRAGSASGDHGRPTCSSSAGGSVSMTTLRRFGPTLAWAAMFASLWLLGQFRAGCDARGRGQHHVAKLDPVGRKHGAHSIAVVIHDKDRTVA